MAFLNQSKENSTPSSKKELEQKKIRERYQSSKLFFCKHFSQRCSSFIDTYWVLPVFIFLAPFSALYGVKGLSALLAISVLPFLLIQGRYLFSDIKQGMTQYTHILVRIRHKLKSIDLGGYIFFLFLLWHGLTVLYAPESSFSDALGIWFIAIIGISFFYYIKQLRAEQVLLAENVFMISVLILGGYIFIESVFHSPIAGFMKGKENEARIIRNEMKACTVFLLMLPAYVNMAWQKGKFSQISVFFLIIIAIMGAFSFTMSAHYIMLLFGGISFALGYWFPKYFFKLTILLIVFLFIFMPFLSMGLSYYLPDSIKAELPNSWLWRLETWNYVSNLIAEKPWLGWGLEAGQSSLFDTVLILRGTQIDLIPKHPHNAILQLWLEGGVLSVGFLSFLLLRFFFFLDKASQYGLMYASSISFVMLVLIAFMVSFGLWSQWFWSAIIIAVGALVLAEKSMQIRAKIS